MSKEDLTREILRIKDSGHTFESIAKELAVLKHLKRYLNEFDFRYKFRNLKNSGRVV